MTTRGTPRRVGTAVFLLLASLFAIAAVRVQAPAPLAEASRMQAAAEVTSASARGNPIDTGRTPAPDASLTTATPDRSATTTTAAPGASLSSPGMPAENPVGSTSSPEAPRALPAAATPAPQQGHISGRVVSAQGSRAGLGQVQVYIAGGYQGTLSAADGSFTIRDVAPGAYELRAERVGMTVGSREITVPEGGTVQVTFELSAQAIGLPEIRSESSAAAISTPSASIPPRTAEVPRGAVVFTPFIVRPKVTNVEEIQEALRREHPATLRNAGIGGSVTVNLFVDPEGRVQNKMIDRSSGNRQLDDAALRIVSGMLFSPAQNRDQPVAVWVTIPLTFMP